MSSDYTFFLTCALHYANDKRNDLKTQRHIPKNAEVFRDLKFFDVIFARQTTTLYPVFVRYSLFKYEIFSS